MLEIVERRLLRIDSSGVYHYRDLGSILYEKVVGMVEMVEMVQTAKQGYIP